MAVNLQTIKDIRNYLARELRDTYPQEEINAITNIINYTIAGIEKLHFLSENQIPVSREVEEKIVAICNELKKGKPIQYILGETTFYNCKIKVDCNTLIPRQETEELVDLIIRENMGFCGNLIDIGTGSGCIAIALAVNLPESKITGIDISEGAVNKARENAKLNNVSITLFKTDILKPDLQMIDKVDIIVSNPPYVRNSEKQYMHKNVLDFEPCSALFVPDNDPLVYYQAIIELAKSILNPEGKIYFEINETMGDPLFQLLRSNGYTGLKIVKDINSKDRIIKGKKNG